MTKILFSADWHIKLNQKNVSAEWQLNRFRQFFSKIHNIECDVHIVGGDVFDKLPTLDELALFFEFIKGVKVKTLIFDGNHEATSKGATFLWRLHDMVQTMSDDLAEIVIGQTTYDEFDNEFDIIPYTDIHNFDPKDFDSNILFTHVRGAIPPHVKPEIDLSKLDRWQTVLAGDLHSYSNSQRNILYPGSPMSVSFHRSLVKTGVIIFDTTTHKHEWINLELPQLYRKTVKSMQEVVPDTFHHIIYEIEGNISELASIDLKHENVDKKIVQKDYSSILKLENMTIKEELVEYLKSILKIDSNNLGKLMSTYEDYITRV